MIPLQPVGFRCGRARIASRIRELPAIVMAGVGVGDVPAWQVNRVRFVKVTQRLVTQRTDMSQRCSTTSIASRHDTGPARTGRSYTCIAVWGAVLMAWAVAGCSSLPQCQKCVMPADEHGYSPLSPFGHYETHWNTWPTEMGEEYELQSEEAASSKAATPSTDTLPPPDGEIPPSPPGGGPTTDPLDVLLPPPDTNQKAQPPLDLTPGGPTAPAAPPDNPLGLPPAGTPPDNPPGGSDLPKTTLPQLPNPDDLKPTGELLPESLLPKDDAPASPKSDEEEKKNTKPLDPPKQSRTPQSDRRGPRLSTSRGRGAPELAFPENRVRKASADVSTRSRPSTGNSGWRGKSTDATTQQDDAGAKWQGRRAATPSVNRQVSHLQNVDRATPVERSATVERTTAVEPIGGQESTGNPLR